MPRLERECAAPDLCSVTSDLRTQVSALLKRVPKSAEKCSDSPPSSYKVGCAWATLVFLRSEQFTGMRPQRLACSAVDHAAVVSAGSLTVAVSHRLGEVLSRIVGLDLRDAK